jgi:amino acid adenylation domain-containing protein
VQSGKGTFEIFDISREKLSALKSLARQKKITLFILLLAALKTLLYRYTGQEDILIGTPIAGRNRREIENLIGLFVNTLVLRTDLSGNPDFNTLLIRVQETALDAYHYQDMPFEKLVEEINPARDMSHTPLYQVMFQLDNAPLPAWHFSGLQLIPLQIDSGMSQVDLSMTCWEAGGLLKGTLEYSTDLFHPSTINRMILHYKILLDDIIAHPDKKLRWLSILTPTEKRQVLDEWNDTKAVYPFNDSIAHLFEIQVEKAPHAIAVIHNNDKITYEQLNSQANQLAHFLKKRQVGPETLVGLCLETSTALIIGMLGILKTGAAYVPLDPDYPRERLDLQLKDLQTSIVITKKYLLPKISGPMMELICLDPHWNKLEGESTENIPIGLLPHNLACVIYTSGSTGHPKGVLVENRNIINLITSFIRSYHVNAEDGIMPITSLASASFAGEVFPILTAGGALVLADIKTYLNMEELISFMDNYNVTILSTVPSMMARLNSYPRKPKKIRLFLCGGEPLFPFHIDKFREAVTFVNGYGLTEATICTTYKILNRQDIPGDAYFSLGKPIMNNQVYILDKYLNVMPIGTTGEIHIAGEGIVRGFLNSPDLTGERLINNPYSAGKKMLKTGDLGSWLPNGEIKFSGRMDNQVQVHGFRIELKEIETHLGLHPMVQDTSVIVREDIPGDKRLVAYLTTGNGKQISSDELRDWLGKRIPSYMIPGVFIFLDALSINPNGKVDIKSLPVPPDTRPHLVAPYEQPQTETEKSIASIWRELLHLEEIGINDNFFDLGGHSLMITQVHSRLQYLYEKEITIVHLFKYTTIHSLANFISGDQTKQPAFDKIYGKIKKRKDVFNQYLQRGSKVKR